ncbi:hypothetical protein DXG01_015466 [Tephrocybe rancida]|nr:hypothetical protein DXG01_015466 [Tephrocybe rancida]
MLFTFANFGLTMTYDGFVNGSGAVDNTIYAFQALSAATNGVTTLIFGWKAWKHKKMWEFSGRRKKSRAEKALFVIVEYGSVYCVFQIMSIISFDIPAWFDTPTVYVCLFFEDIYIELIYRDDEQAPHEDAQSSEDEDGGLDWTKLPGITRPVIPKRGEKDLAPKPGGGSGLQIHVLDGAWAAMFDTLRATHTISSKTISYAAWYPCLGHTHVTLAKGIHFSAMRHSTPRPTIDAHSAEKAHERVELLPEEAIYLAERGPSSAGRTAPAISLDTDRHGRAPDGRAVGVCGDVFLCYINRASARALGVHVPQAAGVRGHTHRAAIALLPNAAPEARTSACTPSYLWQRLPSLPPFWISKLLSPARLVAAPALAAPRQKPRYVPTQPPIQHPSLTPPPASLFCALRLMPPRTTPPPKNAEAPAVPDMLQPAHARPAIQALRPDFQLVVINARTTPMPTLQELTDLFGDLLTLPPPRIRRPLPAPSAPSAPDAAPSLSPAPSAPPAPSPASPAPAAPPPPASCTSHQTALNTTAVPPDCPRWPHPFMALSAGRTLVVLVGVDTGGIGFFQFGQGRIGIHGVASGVGGRSRRTHGRRSITSIY